MSVSLSRRCVAEAIGTLAIVYFGCGACTVLTGSNKHLIVNLIFGMTVAAAISALGHISKAHFNPAVTIAFAAIKRFPWKEVAPYCLSQLLGAIVGAVMIYARFNEVGGATIPTERASIAVVSEGVLTFFLMFVIVGVSSNERFSSGFAGIAIGLTVCLAGLYGGAFTGCSMNPARTVAPALFTPNFPYQILWVYIVGPIVGAVSAAFVYQWIQKADLK